MEKGFGSNKGNRDVCINPFTRYDSDIESDSDQLELVDEGSLQTIHKLKG